MDATGIGEGLKVFFYLAMVGVFALAVVVGAIVGTIVGLPFALWTHDLSLLLPFCGGGASIAAIAAALYGLAELWNARR